MSGGKVADASAAVFVYAPLVALLWYPLSRLAAPRTAISYCHTAVLAGIAFESRALRAGARAVYERLKAEHPECASTELESELAEYETWADVQLVDEARAALAADDPARFNKVTEKSVQRLGHAIRPELLDPAAGHTLHEVARTAADDGRPWAVREAVRLLETSAVAACEHLTIEMAVNIVNRGAAFEALLHRSLLAGELQRRRVARHEIPDPTSISLGGRSCLWLHELDGTFGTVVVGWRTSEGDTAATSAVLTTAAQHALRDLAAGRPARMTAGVCDELGEKLLGQLAQRSGGIPDSLVVIPSMALRPLPVEALTICGKPVLGPETTVAVAPALTTWARLPQPPRLSRGYGLLGVFDEDLPGAAAEMQHLRRLGRSGVVDGQAVQSPGKLGAQLREHSYDVLTLAVHGTVSPAGLTLHLPRGTATGVDVLGWHLPPIVVLAACRSGAAGTIRWPIDLATACLERGASTVIVSRWPVKDSTTATQMEALYTQLADGGTPGAALRSATCGSASEPLWSRANLTVFGRAD